MPILLHMHLCLILSLHVLYWTLLPPFSIQRAPETSPGWEMNGLGEEQAGQEMQRAYGMGGEAERGSWGGGSGGAHAEMGIF